MKITQKYSHINGEEYLIVHHKKLYKEIELIIKGVTPEMLIKEKQKERYYTLALLQSFKNLFYKYGWEKKLSLEELRNPHYYSNNQINFIKNKIAVEVQVGKYFNITYDLFVRYLPSYLNQIINVGIEILPTKNMMGNMSSEQTWFEKEVPNVLRHGRTNPPVPLLILGIEP